LFCGTEIGGKWITAVFDVKFETLRHKHFSAPHWCGLVVSKINSRTLAPEYTANPSLGVTGNPKPITIPTDKK
jgi:hypothetical protein